MHKYIFTLWVNIENRTRCQKTTTKKRFINSERNGRHIGTQDIIKNSESSAFLKLYIILAEMLQFITEPLDSYHHNMTAVKTITPNK